MRLGHLVCLSLLAALALAGCGPIFTTPTPIPPTMTPRGEAPPTAPVTPYAEGLSVTLSAASFAPEALAVAAHSTVVFTNGDRVTHSVVQGTPEDAAGFDSGPLAPGGTFSFTFEAAGDYGYFCREHPEARGLIHVVP
ncbi:MAG: hypothetical protein IT317_11145 [Anaerolineales bacterium]|nr:hypothetical protein [Anaerolineales bacterium]